MVLISLFIACLISRDVKGRLCFEQETLNNWFVYVCNWSWLFWWCWAKKYFEQTTYCAYEIRSFDAGQRNIFEQMIFHHFLEIKCVILLSDKGIELVKWVNSPRSMIISLNLLSFQPGRNRPTFQETRLL